MFVFAGTTLIILGLAMLLAMRQAYSIRREVGDDYIVMTVTVAGWVLVFCGVLWLVSPIGMPIVLVIFAMTVAKYREGERRALLWTLGIAAEKGLPLAPSARAFAAWRCDEMARRATRMADLLDAGIPLSNALRESGNPLPTDAALLVRLGASSQAQSLALRESAQDAGNAENAWRPVFEQMMYLLIVIQICFIITAFILIKIVPTFREIFLDFGVETPIITRWILAAADSFQVFGWLLIVPFLVSIGLMLVSMFFYARGQIWIPWPLSRLFGRSESPTILRGLAVCVEQGMPMPEALHQVAENYPKFSAAQRIRVAAHSASQGRDWCQSLLNEEVITQSEAAVLASATRAGNLAWALREVADLGNRRMAYRARTTLGILTPVCLLLIAIPVALLAFGCIGPLTTLIETLSHG